MSDFTTESYRMVCGSAEAEAKTYRKVQGSRGVWLIPTNATPGEGVHFHDPSDRNSDGYAGRTLSFPLEDGTVYEAKGPWHANSGALFSDTGIDLRNTHRTFVVLSKSVETNKSHQRVMKDVVYQDDVPKIGSFDRYKELIAQYPEANFYYSQSSGGSSSGPTKYERKP